MIITPEYQILIKRYLQLVDQLGERHPTTLKVQLEVIHHAPPELKEHFHKMAKDMGLIPKPFGYLDNGDPIYDINSMANALGLLPSEVQAHIDEMNSDLAELGLPTCDPLQTSQINLKQ